MIVNEQKPIVFINKCEAIFKDWQLEDAILWYALRPVCRVKSVFLHGRYPAVSIHGEKLHIHRLIFSWHFKRRLRRHEYVHHKDENNLNAKLSNLEIMLSKKHQSHHNKGRKQSVEHVQRRINAVSLTRYGHIVYETPELLDNALNDKD
ncbi:MAG: hypothetical protein KAR06_05825 [Deltaproteobacteria bacterium]|nr:hypothetical protein [Deltaproteobacteria bacterium]